MLIKLSLPFLALLLSTTAPNHVMVVGQVIETKQCMLPSNSQVLTAAKSVLTEDTCRFDSGIQCPSGCCRFHTHILVCDKDGDRFTRQPCVCNDNTNNSGIRGGNNNGGSSPGIPLPPTTPAPAAAPSTSAPINTNPKGRPNDEAITCAEPTVWQGLGLDRQNCTASSDCAKTSIASSPGATLCCRKLFCFCDTFNSANECVA